MKKLITIVLFTFFIVGNAMSGNAKSTKSESFHDNTGTKLTSFAYKQVDADTTDKEFKIESIKIKASGDSCSVVIEGQMKKDNKELKSSINATATTCDKAREMAFRGVEAINKGEEEKES